MHHHRMIDIRLYRRTLILLCLVICVVLTSPRLAIAEDTSVWMWPTRIPVTVTRSFNPPEQPWLPGHRGVDLDVPVGSTLYAPADGTVAFAGVVASRPVLSIRHLGITSTYEPVTALVTVGQYVRRGDAIGIVEDGHTPGPLHWGAKISKNTYVDPIRLTIGPTVLKEWDG